MWKSFGEILLTAQA